MYPANRVISQCCPANLPVQREREREATERDERASSDKRCRNRQIGTCREKKLKRENRPRLARQTKGKMQIYTKRRMERDRPLCHLGSLSTVIGLSLISWAQLRLAWLQISSLSPCQQQHMGI